MSIDIKLNAAHDLAIVGKDVLLADGDERIGQQIKVTLLTFMGEWFLDVTHGVPYFEAVLVKAPDRAKIEAVIRAAVMAVPGVRRVTRMDLQIDRQGRSLQIALDADTAEGPVKVQAIKPI